jgi:hypothetical protein
MLRITLSRLLDVDGSLAAQVRDQLAIAYYGGGNRRHDCLHVDHLDGCAQALLLPLRRLQPRQQGRRVNALGDHVRDVADLRFEILHSRSIDRGAVKQRCVSRFAVIMARCTPRSAREVMRQLTADVLNDTPAATMKCTLRERRSGPETISASCLFDILLPHMRAGRSCWNSLLQREIYCRKGATSP